MHYEFIQVNSIKYIYMKLKFVAEWNNVALWVWIGAYCFNSTKLALASLIGVLFVCLYLVYCSVYLFKENSVIENKTEYLSKLINQIIYSVAIIVLYFIARW